MGAKNWLILVILSSCIWVSAQASCPRFDLTTQYLMTHHYEASGSVLDAALLEKLKSYHLLLVPGFFSNVVLKAGDHPLFRYFQAGEYFDEQLRWLRTQGLTVTRVSLWSENSPRHNARRISSIIRRSAKPVIVIAHSKGGIDILETLIRYPELRGKVSGFLAIQTPFQGTPVADFIFGKLGLRILTRWSLRFLGGSELSLLSLTEAQRQAYQEKFFDEISEIIQHIPIISVASWKNSEGWKVDTPLKFVRDVMMAQGKPNDGLIPVQNMILPGTHFVALEGIDHMVPVMHSPFLAFDRVRFLQTLLILLSRRLL